jgi:glutamate dehydrogenase
MMQTTADDGRAQQLDLVLGLVRTRTTAVRRDALERFVVRYFGQVDPEDLAERAPADLYGAALSHWNFARKREPGHARVRVFNPSVEDDGWQSTHTIIEIVNDDMPFLVDSVTMEVNRHGSRCTSSSTRSSPSRAAPTGRSRTSRRRRRAMRGANRSSTSRSTG